VFTTASHLLLFEADQSIPRPPKIHFNIILLSGLWFSRWSFPLWLSDRKLYAPLLSPISATYRVQYVLLDLVIRIVYGEQYRSYSSSLCCLLHSQVTSSFLGPNTSITTLFSKIPSPYFFPYFDWPSFTSIQNNSQNYILVAYCLIYVGRLAQSV